MYRLHHVKVFVGDGTLGGMEEVGDIPRVWPPAGCRPYIPPVVTFLRNDQWVVGES